MEAFFEEEQRRFAATALVNVTYGPVGGGFFVDGTRQAHIDVVGVLHEEFSNLLHLLDEGGRASVTKFMGALNEFDS
ncbi:Uncharacterised protein [uncultured archaeon]|nr:Uncharacterised protein [uncultured archaeon]